MTKYFETKNQWQEESWKILQYVEIKQYASKQAMGQRRNQKKNQNILKQTKMETQHTKLMRCSKSNAKREILAINAHNK